MADHASLKVILRAAVQAALAAGHDNDTIAVAVYDVVADEQEALFQASRHAAKAHDATEAIEGRLRDITGHVAAMPDNDELAALTRAAEAANAALKDALQARHVALTGRTR